MADERIYDRALGLLAVREHSRAELRNKLRHKGFSSTAIDAVLVQLTDTGTLSDARFIEVYVRSRAVKGYGPNRIQLELSERGIESGVAQDYLSQAEIDWQSHIAKAWRKRFSALPEDFTATRKQQQYLYNRGFSTEMIKAWFERLSAEEVLDSYSQSV